MEQTPNNLAAYIWSIADLLRGDFRQSQYGRIILPFTLLRRLECVLEASKDKVLKEHERVRKMDLGEEGQEKLLLRATDGLAFYNTSKMDMGKLGEADIKDNLESYLRDFSRDAREIFEYFNFAEFIGQLADANLLYRIVQRVRTMDLSPEAITNHDMGLVFEELIRRFAESSNDTAGEHFTPRDIVRLTTSLVFLEDDEALTKPGIIRTIYDPTAGTGGFLSAGEEYVRELNPHAVLRAFGQELNPESYAICKADMLIKGQDVSNIKLGNTLSNDQLYADKFDYMLSNPPFGVDWKKVEKEVRDEHEMKGFNGRFGPGLPRVSDGSLLFLMHLISKLRDKREDGREGGARIGIILNGSPLFTGGAGSGESEIRRYILEADLLEAIVALPTDMFYNTGIATYVWILSNKKPVDRKGKVQLINGGNLFSKMRKSLGSKRKFMDEGDIKTITRAFGAFDVAEVTEEAAEDGTKPWASKIFDNHEFGFRRITIERPLRESFQFSDERIEELRFAPKQLGPVMKWIFENYGQGWSDDEGCEQYGVLSDDDIDVVRAFIKSDFGDLKEKDIKTVLDPKAWRAQKQILLKARAIQASLGSEQYDDMNEYDAKLKTTGVKLEAKEKKQITDAVSWKNPDAEKVVNKVHKGKQPDPMYGLFPHGKDAVEYKPDSDLRDYENVALDPSRPVNEVNEAYVEAEVLPHVPDAWIDPNKRDEQDGEIGIVGYEVPFNRYFYAFRRTRSLEQIDRELREVSQEIAALLDSGSL